MGWTAQVKHRALFRARRAAGCLVTTFILVGNDWTNSTLLVSECHFFSRVSSTCLVDAAQCCGMAAGGLEAQSKTFERYLILTMSRWKRIFFFFSLRTNRYWNDLPREENDWTLLRLNWTEFWAVFTQWFCQVRLDQMMPEVPSCTWYSVIMCCCNGIVDLELTCREKIRNGIQIQILEMITF